MKKFIGKLSFFIVIIMTIIFFLNAVYMSRTSKIESEYMINKYDSVPNNIQICNLGSSHGKCDFNYAEIEKEYNCFNFGLTGQRLSYDYRVLDYYKDSISEGCIVYIPISYFSFFGIPDEEERNFESRNKRYYLFLDYSHIKKYNIKTYIYVKYLPILAAGDDLRYLFILPDEVEDIGKRTAYDVDVESSAITAYKTHIVNDKFDNLGNRIINQEEIESLGKIILLCREKKARPILVTTPYLKEYTDCITQNDKTFYTDFYHQIEEIVDKYNIDYYDYSFDKRFITNYSLFMDADHLNTEGATKFVTILLNESGVLK